MPGIELTRFHVFVFHRHLESIIRQDVLSKSEQLARLMVREMYGFGDLIERRILLCYITTDDVAVDSIDPSRWLPL